MQMTKSRKVVAMLLAVLMAFSSMSVFASALNYNDDGDIIFESTDGQQSTDGSNLQSTIDVKFYDAEGNEIADLGTVTPGQTIQARVFVGTNYYTSTSDLMFYYDPDFMDVNYPEVTIGDQTVKHGVVAVNTAAIQPATGKTATVTAEINAVATTADEGSFTVALMAEADSATFVLDPTVYLFAIDMVVKANASADDDGIGAVYAKASDYATEANLGGYTNIPYGTADDNQYEAAPSYFFNGALTVTNTSVTINNKATFYNDTDDTTGTVVEGKVGNEYTVPTATKEGYTFKGWASASGLTIAADATTFTMPAEANVEYTAIWNQDVSVTVDPNGGKFADNTTEAKTYTAEQGTVWADKPAEPTYDGYKFMGWEIDGATVDALPDNYPVVDGDKIAYTYTAQWEKLVKITIDPNGGTFADNTTAAKEYQDTDPATAVIVGGQAWNTSAVPTYDIPAYTYAATGISNPGYALMGWRTSDGTTIQSFPTTFPEDDETYTAVWQAMDVRIYYFADATAAAAADVNTDTSNTNAARVNYVSVPYGTQYTVLSYTNDGESVATWTTPDGATYAPGSTLNLTAPTVTFGANGIPNKIILIASNAQFTGDDKYEASFITNGGIWADTNTTDTKVALYSDGETITAPADITKAGYTFKGWTPGLGTMTTEGAEFEAIWEVKTYEVTFVSEGAEYEKLTFTVENEVEFPADPEKEGNAFSGWYKDAACTDGNELSGWNDILENADENNAITVYAKWTVNEVVITFNPNNGTEAYTVTRNYNDKILGADVEDPSKANYYFMGWVDADGNKVTADDIVKVAAEYTAVYAPGEVEFNYYVDGNIVASVNVPYGTTTQILTYTTADITVDTWSTADGALTLTAGQDYTVAPATLAAINLYADEITETTYTATFKLGADDAVWADGSAGDYPVDGLKTGDAITAPADPTRAGYVFGGWSPAVGTIAGADVEFTAIWNNGPTYTVTYKIIKVSNGQIKGTEDLEVVTGVNYGETLDVPADAEIGDSYEFTETWVVGSEAEVTKYLNGEDSTAKAYDSDSISGVVVKGDMTVFAVYNQGAFAVKFYAYGVGTPTTAECNTLVGEEMMIPAGSELTAPEAPEYANFIFVGWFDADGNEVKTGDAVTAPINAYAKYERVTVKLVAKEGNTAMVERDGVVETYNTFAAGDKTPYGVTSIIAPNSDAYTATDYSAWYVYGFAPNLKVSDLEDYVMVTGDGSYKVYNKAGEEVAETAVLGTGLVIKVIDNETNTVVEEFYVVIFGDIDGNGVINGNDSGRLSSEVISRNWSTGANTKNYLVKAADLDLNGIINGNDGGKLKTVTLKNAAINQITGYSN